MKKALITGITGQDGSYMAELLLEKEYAVIGVTSGASDRQNLNAVADRIELVEGNISEESFVRSILEKHEPDEVYNLASVATVASPWDKVGEIARITALAPLNFLETIKTISLKTRFFQASSAEMFGVVSGPQSESAPFHPRNPYGIAKVFAHEMVRAYRRDHGIYAVSGILFNHESPRRKSDFVVRKICLSLARVKLGQIDSFTLGSIDARRDWGFAGDFVRAMYLSLQADAPDDYVIASGAIHAVRDIVAIAATELEMPIVWEGTGADERCLSEGKVIITIDTNLYRPQSAEAPSGDISKARTMLGWEPAVPFNELIRLMVRSDLAALQSNV